MLEEGVWFEVNCSSLPCSLLYFTRISVRSLTAWSTGVPQLSQGLSTNSSLSPVLPPCSHPRDVLVASLSFVKPLAVATELDWPFVGGLNGMPVRTWEPSCLCPGISDDWKYSRKLLIHVLYSWHQFKFYWSCNTCSCVFEVLQYSTLVCACDHYL